MLRRSEDRFLRIIRSTKELPPFLQDVISQYGLDPTIETTIYIPPQSYPIPTRLLFFSLPYRWRITPYRLLIFNKNELTIISITPDNPPEYISIPLNSFIDVTFSTQLLYAYVLVRWESEIGLQEKRIEYNTVGETVIRKEFNSFWQEKIKKSLCKNSPTSAETLEVSADPFLKNIPIKFHNYLLYSCLPEEQAIIGIFQPAAYGKGLLKPMLSPARMISITNCQIIFIEEEMGYASQYSVVIHYCPYENIKQIEFRPDQQFTWINIILGVKQLSTTKTFPLLKTGIEYFTRYLKPCLPDLIIS